MGCGVIETHSNKPKHIQYAQRTLQELLPRIKTNPPLLSETNYLAFASSIRQNKPTYILPVGISLLNQDCPPAPILQKWKILLYGLEKEDYVYRRCLGFQVRNEHYKPTNQQQEKINSNASYHQLKSITHHHSCFQQIEKDLNRTFSFQQHTQMLFEKVLKRIANHFPSMGYTQGVNFVVGYLLLQGYSEADTFWMFTHLAMNKHYLLMGLYEDGFPLANILTLIFKNMLRRLDPQLYNHIYESLMLDESVWIFKWFITIYIYSFPLPAIKHIWDIVIQLGTLGLVYFACALVIHLKSHLLNSLDPCDVSQFLQSLKTLSTFNQTVKMNQVIQATYQIRLTKDDLYGIPQCKPSFYQEYYKIMLNEMEIVSEGKLKVLKVPQLKLKNKEDPLLSRIHLWFLKLLEQRIEFTNKKEEDKFVKEEIPEELKDDYAEMQKSVKMLTDRVIQNESQKTLKELPEENAHDYFHELAVEDNAGPTLTDSPQENISNHTRLLTRISYDIGQEIDELEDQSDSNQCQQLQPSVSQKTSRVDPSPPESSIKLEEYYHNGQAPQQFNINLHDERHRLEKQRRKIKQLSKKANNIPISNSQARSGFGLAGQNILGNLSITNSQYSSFQSKSNSHKPKKQKENNISRYCKDKFKIQALSQLSHPSNEFSSEHQESIDRRTDKDSISGFTQRENIKERPSFGKDQNYLERRTQLDIMTISHGPEKNSSGPPKDAISEIEIFNGEGLFKKKKRGLNRNSIITSINQDLPMAPQLKSINDIKPPYQSRNRTYNDEQSLQSILELSAIKKVNGNKASPLDNMLFELESVK